MVTLLALRCKQVLLWLCVCICFSSNSSCHRCGIAATIISASAGVEKLLLRLVWMMNINVCVFSLVASAVELFGYHLTSSIFLLLFFFFAFQSIAVFFSFLIIFSHFLHTVGAVKWPIVKEQTVCVWDISCWFSGTLAWWMARQKTPNNSWFASRETCSLRLNNVKLSLVYVLHLLRTSTAPFHSRGNSRPYQFQIEQ